MSFDYQTQMDAATKSARDQIELNHESLQKQLDAADRLIMRKAADATIQMAAAADPTK